jgi:hypothetical protein
MTWPVQIRRDGRSFAISCLTCPAGLFAEMIKLKPRNAERGAREYRHTIDRDERPGDSVNAHFTHKNGFCTFWKS